MFLNHINERLINLIKQVPKDLLLKSKSLSDITSIVLYGKVFPNLLTMTVILLVSFCQTPPHLVAS